MRSVISEERAREVKQIAGTAWLIAVAYFALRNASRPVERDIGCGVGGQCGRVFASQIPQLALGVTGGVLLLLTVNARTVKSRGVAVAAALLFAAWIPAATVLPGHYLWDCVN